MTTYQQDGKKQKKDVSLRELLKFSSVLERGGNGGLRTCALPWITQLGSDCAPRVVLPVAQMAGSGAQLAAHSNDLKASQDFTKQAPSGEQAGASGLGQQQCSRPDLATSCPQGCARSLYRQPVSPTPPCSQRTRPSHPWNPHSRLLLRFPLCSPLPRTSSQLPLPPAPPGPTTM